jgi:hypothetical protein
VVDKSAEAIVCFNPKELVPVVQRTDPIRHAAAVTWAHYANENIRPMDSIGERSGGSGEYKKISLRVMIRVPSVT